VTRQKPRREQAPIVTGRRLVQLFRRWSESEEGRGCYEPSILKSTAHLQYLTNRIERAYMAGASDVRFEVFESLSSDPWAVQRLKDVLRQIHQSLSSVQGLIQAAEVVGITDYDAIGDSAQLLSAALERAEALANLLAEVLPSEGDDDDA
jgi:hypothetical protein